MPDNYNGSFGLYSGDISVITLTTDVSISDAVSPICVDWNNTCFNNNISNGNIGKVNLLCTYSSNIKTFKY